MILVRDPYTSDRLYLNWKDLFNLLFGGVIIGNALIIRMRNKDPRNVPPTT